MAQALEALCQPIWTLYSVRHLLCWDQQVKMPSSAGSARAEQLATLDKVCHQLLTSPAFQAALDQAEERNDLPPGYLRAARRAYALAAQLPSSLVEERARVQAQAYEAWLVARRQRDFGLFLPHLRRVFELARQVSECRGYQQHPYDALVDEYEPGMTTAQLQQVFSGLVAGLVPLLQAIAAAPPAPSGLLEQEFPLAQQQQFSHYLLQQIGFSFEHGRLDQSAHPFCSASSALDVRLTDRMDPRQLTMSIFGALHEGGHGLYEQGSPQEWIGTPIAGGCSLGIHESQSRLWENLVGRSLPFWEAHFPKLVQLFPRQLSGYSVRDFYRAVNRVQPSFIRVEADEITYNLHVALRFQLERDMLNGELDPAELPSRWNQLMQQQLGITPPHDSLGCLQDIHWADGLIGYFPTYTLGNLVAAQLWQKLQQDLPQLEESLRRGDCSELLQWLRHKVHRHAASVTPQELLQLVCQQGLDQKPFLDYLWNKYREIYPL